MGAVLGAVLAVKPPRPGGLELPSNLLVESVVELGAVMEAVAVLELEPPRPGGLAPPANAPHPRQLNQPPCWAVLEAVLEVEEPVALTLAAFVISKHDLQTSIVGKHASGLLLGEH